MQLRFTSLLINLLFKEVSKVFDRHSLRCLISAIFLFESLNKAARCLLV